MIGRLEERLQSSALASIIRPEAYIRSAAAETQATAERRAREDARSRTRVSSDAGRSDGEGITAAANGGEGFEDVPREDFESASEMTSAIPAHLSGGELEGASLDESPRWPDEASESSFLAEQGSGGSPSASRPAFAPKKSAHESAAQTEAAVTLPPLQNLVDRLPAATREVLEDLFRARFVSVKQIQKAALKN